MVRTGAIGVRAAGRPGLLLLLLLAAAAPARGEVTAVSAGDSLIWHRDGMLLPAGRSAVRLLIAARDQGLDPADYDAPLLDSLSRVPWPPPADRARLDLLLTANVVRYLDHLRGGRAPYRRPREEIVTALRDAIAADALPALAASLEPRLVQYRYLRRALAEYRLLAEDPTLGVLPAGRTVHPGEPYEAADALVRLLVALGDLPTLREVPAGPSYDGPLVEGVTRFQARHGLAADGVLGPATFRALNLPLRRRVRQLELAMERLRRLPPLSGGRLVVVNVPAFELFAFDSAGAVGTPALASRAVVGRAMDTRTPVLFEEIRYVDFWPYWNVPRSILANEILPILPRRPDYLRRNAMEVVDRHGRVRGDRVTPAILAGLRDGTLRVRQRPGPHNALGPVKFVFPNAADVYIHGTPHTELFQRARRDLSHGCIRVEDFGGLATWALRGLNGWTADSTASAIGAGRSRRLTLADPLPVAVFYTTAAATADGRVYFYEDLYGLDRRLDAELRAPSYFP